MIDAAMLPTNEAGHPPETSPGLVSCWTDTVTSTDVLSCHPRGPTIAPGPALHCRERKRRGGARPVALPVFCLRRGGAHRLRQPAQRAGWRAPSALRGDLRASVGCPSISKARGFHVPRMERWGAWLCHPRRLPGCALGGCSTESSRPLPLLRVLSQVALVSSGSLGRPPSPLHTHVLPAVDLYVLLHHSKVATRQLRVAEEHGGLYKNPLWSLSSCSASRSPRAWSMARYTPKARPATRLEGSCAQRGCAVPRHEATALVLGSTVGNGDPRSPRLRATQHASDLHANDDRRWCPAARRTPVIPCPSGRPSGSPDTLPA